MIPLSMTLSDPKPQFQGRAGFSASAELLVGLGDAMIDFTEMYNV